MKKIFSFIKTIWNQFLTLLKKKNMPIESDIENLINTYISNSNYCNSIRNSGYTTKASFNALSKNSFEVLVKMSFINTTYLITQLTFSNGNGNYILDITDGICNFKNIPCTQRASIYYEADMMNMRLTNEFENIFKKYHP